MRYCAEVPSKVEYRTSLLMDWHESPASRARSEIICHRRNPVDYSAQCGFIWSHTIFLSIQESVGTQFVTMLATSCVTRNMSAL